MRIAASCARAGMALSAAHKAKRTIRVTLFAFDTRFANDLAPGRVAFAHHRPELFGRAADGEDARRAQSVGDLRILQHLDGLGVQALDRLARRARRHKEPVPERQALLVE